MSSTSQSKRGLMSRIQHTSWIAIPSLLVAVVLAVGLNGCSNRDPKPGEATLRIGWQPPWANQGQIVAIMKNTDVLKKENVKAEFVPFTYGAPLIEAALAGRIDVAFAGDQPIMNLVSKSDDWKIVARMTRYRSGIVVPLESSVQNLTELEGKTVATAFGSTTHRDLVRVFSENGLEGKVKIVNLDQAEHAAVIEAGGRTVWGQIDAIATYDPTITAAINKGAARILQTWASPALVAIRTEVLASRREEVVRFLRAYRDSYVRYAADPSKANEWYSAESRLPLTATEYATLAGFEPNLSAKSAGAVSLQIDEAFRMELQKNADVALKLGILKSKLDLNRVIVDGLTP